MFGNILLLKNYLSGSGKGLILIKTETGLYQKKNSENYQLSEKIGEGCKF